MQRDLLKTISKAIEEIRYSFLLHVVSRPNAHILHTFNYDDLVADDVVRRIDLSVVVDVDTRRNLPPQLIGQNQSHSSSLKGAAFKYGCTGTC